MAEIWVCRRKHELTEFIEVEGFAEVSIILLNDVFCIVGSSTQVVLIHEIEKFITCDGIYAISINQLEEFHWAKVRVSSKVLPPQFNLKKYALIVI